MAKKNIIIKPLLTGKTNQLAEGDAALNQYTFVVNKAANKIEIKKAIEEKFDVNVISVNTLIQPGKSKNRVIKGRYAKGRTASIKKAIVTVQEGQSINEFFGPMDFGQEVVEDNTDAVAEA